MTSKENNIARMQLKQFETFKTQDPANFDVAFEVDGKLIYANKYVLETISTTFKSMLSERWKSKDDVIKLDTYSYDNFFQLLTFVYSGACELTDDNISTMVDIAEFYDIKVFKGFCDEYISKMEYNMNTVFVVLNLVAKYSLRKSKAAVDKFTAANFPMIVKSDKFMALEKSSIEAIVTFQRGPGQEEELFEAVYKWAEKQFISDESPIKQKYVNMNEGMKAELSGILPHIKFNKMSPGFLYDFVVTKGFLFTYEQLSAILTDYHKITVKVMDLNARKTVTGSFVETFNVYDCLKAIDAQRCQCAGYWKCDITPPFPSDLKKNKNVQFYFVLCNKKFEVKKTANVTDDDYLICEMSGDSFTEYNTNKCFLYVSRNAFPSLF